jgi:hypothetical protein
MPTMADSGSQLQSALHNDRRLEQFHATINQEEQTGQRAQSATCPKVLLGTGCARILHSICLRSSL